MDFTEGQMSDSRRLTSHPSNCKLRLDFLADCRANGMDEHRVQQRYATTEHLIRQAGDKELCEYNIGELKQLLADAQALSSNRVGKPLSHERLRKVFLHARELLTYAREVHPTRFKQHPRHLKNLQIPLPADGVSTERRR